MLHYYTHMYMGSPTADELVSFRYFLFIFFAVSVNVSVSQRWLCADHDNGGDLVELFVYLLPSRFQRLHL